MLHWAQLFNPGEHSMATNKETINSDKDDFNSIFPDARPYIKSNRDVKPLENTRQVIEFNKWRTARASTIGAVSLALVVFIAGGIKYGIDFANELRPHTAVDGTILDPGTASIQKVSFEMPPITLATAETKVEEYKVGMSEHVTTIFGDIPLSSSTLTKSAVIDTDITIDPKKVTYEYDALKNKLKFLVPNSSVSAKVSVALGSETNNGQRETPGILVLGPFLKDLANLTAGTFTEDGSGVDIPGLGVFAKKDATIGDLEERMLQYGMVTSVDAECTNQIPKVPHYKELIETNIKTALQGRLLNPSDSVSGPGSSLTLLMNKLGYEIKQIVADADIEMEGGTTIAPDQANIDKFKKLIGSKNFTFDKGTKTMKCGISPDLIFKNSTAGSK